jgi:hypothetical protein
MENLKNSNWKTTVAGLVGAIFLAIKPIINGDFKLSQDWPTLVGAVLVAALGFFAKDHDVTGGTPSTPATRQ